MKKSVVILIGIIYIASIALVSFFGLQFKTFNEIVYTGSIEILNEDIKTDPTTGEKYVVIRPDANGERRYQILYRVHPDNATNQAVSFVYDKQISSVSIDENGVVTFMGKGVIEVQIISKDGSGASATLKIFAR